MYFEDETKPIISIITPIFNSEAYISECIDSVLKQTMSNFEMICIDDCSSDSSFEIVKYYSKLDSRIRSVRKTLNSGVSDSRNVGLQYARGEWVFFLDSDDTICENCLERMLANSNGIEFISAGLVVCDIALNQIEQLSGEGRLLTPLGALNTIGQKGSPVDFIAPKLYRLELIRKNKIKFCSTLFLGEDQLFNIEYLSVCTSSDSSICVIPDGVYFYRANSQGATAWSRDDTRAICFIENKLEECQMILEKYDETYSGSRFIWFVKRMKFDYLLLLCKGNKKKIGKASYYYRTITDLYNELVNTLDFRRRLKYILVLHFPYVFPVISFIKKRLK